MNSAPVLADMIKFHRKQTGLTQLELANLAGVGKTVVFDVENGKESIRFDTLVKITNALNIQLRYESPLMKLYNNHNHQL